MSLVAGTRCEVCVLNRVTVAGVSQTLAQLGVTIDPKVKRISLQNTGPTDNIYVQYNAAANNNSFILLPYGATTLNVGGLAASRLQFYCPNSTTMNVQQMGD